jgi:hypothetical protein
MMMAKDARAPKANIFTFLFNGPLHERWCPNGILQPPICADQVHLALHHNHSEVDRFTEVFIASTTIMVIGFAFLLPSVLNYQHVGLVRLRDTNLTSIFERYCTVTSAIDHTYPQFLAYVARFLYDLHMFRFYLFPHPYLLSMIWKENIFFKLKQYEVWWPTS